MRKIIGSNLPNKIKACIFTEGPKLLVKNNQQPITGLNGGGVALWP